MQYGSPLPTSAPVDEDFVATAGEPLAPGNAIATQEAVVAAMSTVHDPEIPVNIYELGLIYQTDIKENGDIFIAMTLTAPARVRDFPVRVKCATLAWHTMSAAVSGRQNLEITTE